tara:strand:- start:4847 stop:5188 length:342 start_codon:yes stop_codon:yes gene_type:complete
MSKFGNRINKQRIEKAAQGAEVARLRMKQDEFKAQQGNYRLQQQAQQEAARPPRQEPMQFQPAAPMPPGTTMMSPMGPPPIGRPMRPRKKKKQKSLMQMGDDIGPKKGIQDGF